MYQFWIPYSSLLSCGNAVKVSNRSENFSVCAGLGCVSQMELAHKSEASKNIPQNIVDLNVGGIRFTTTVSTLTSRGENFFTGLLSGKYGSSKDERCGRDRIIQFVANQNYSGAYFIDRNGRYFEFILDFLRTGIVLVPSEIPLEGVLASLRLLIILTFFFSLIGSSRSQLLLRRHRIWFVWAIWGGSDSYFMLLFSLIITTFFSLQGLYSTVMKPGDSSAKGSLVMIEHTDDISVVAITGLIDKLYIEQVIERVFSIWERNMLRIMLRCDRFVLFAAERSS